ncbi:MAG: DUF1553 domain-containing protein [Pirellulaceae bacterium]
MQFAQWLADTSHPLTARVYINRVWGWHFGTGIVASTENFGKLGDQPSHPQLLDWLARQFMQSGWSTKSMHRLMVLSSTYQMASRHEDPAVTQRLAELDPDNRLLSHFPVRRLEAEPIRDAMLAVSGTLDRTFGGKTVPLRNRQFVFNHTSQDFTRYDSRRRAMYLPIIRNNLYSLFTQFDYPDPTTPTGSRNETVVAPQALLMLNADVVLDSADAWAERLSKKFEEPTDRVQHAYVQAFGRPATDVELERALAFLGSEESGSFGRLALFCHSLFASNEFIYLR